VLIGDAQPADASDCPCCSGSATCSIPNALAAEPAPSACSEHVESSECRREFHPLRTIWRVLVRGHERRVARRCRR
jgi:hypothetical protein